MKVFVAIHQHREGTTEYVIHANTTPEEGVIESNIDCFDGDSDYLEVYEISDKPDIVINN